MVEISREEFSEIDPDLLWVLGPGRRYFFLPGRQEEGHEWLPLLVRLREKDASGKDVTADSFARGEHLSEQRRAAWQRAIRVPSLYTDSEIGAKNASYITAMMNMDYVLHDFADDPELREEVRGAVVTVEPGRPLDVGALPRRREESRKVTEDYKIEEAAVPSGAIVMGVIDDGIAFAHERFRKRAASGAIGSRVASWWLQDGPYLPPSTPSVPYGCQLNQSEINTLLANCTFNGIVDEEMLYRSARLIDYRQDRHKSAAWRLAHGTHVMDLACGFEQELSRDDRPIICVQLPVAVTAKTSGGSLIKYVVDAMWYILDRASRIPGGSHSPVVINISYGRFAGPHDGSAAIELAIELIIAISELRGVHLRVVLPAGNSYLSRTHAEIQFQRMYEVVPLPWRVLPDDRAPSFAQIWLPRRVPGGPANRINVTITAPTGESHTVSEVAGFAEWTTASGAVYALAQYHVPPFTNRGVFKIFLLATTDLDSTAPLAPAGIWKIDLQNVGLGQHEVVHAWVQRDDSLYGFPQRGRQSFFEDPKYVRFDNAGRDKETDDADSRVKRKSTINAMATGVHPVVMGGYVQKERVPAKYSCAGAKEQPPRWPDAMTVSEDSRVHSGVIAAGSRSGSRVAMGGTSVAAPQAARLVANLLSLADPANRASVHDRAQADDPVYIPNERGGFGRIKRDDPVIKVKRYDGP